MSIDAQFRDGVLRVALKVEDARNALDLETIADMRTALAGARARADLRLVVLESALDRVFSLGMNLTKLEAAEDEGVWASFDAIADYVELLVDLASMPVPTLAVVDGVAAGGGVELACVCDTLIGTSNASFSIAQLRKGIFPSITSAVLIPRIGQARVLHWALSGQTYSARRLFDLGLISQLCDAQERDRALSLFIERVLAFDPRTLRAGIGALRVDSDLTVRIRRAHALFTLNCLAHREEGGLAT
jgi:enoyl-CoA hydratase/carnithine racemase